MWHLSHRSRRTSHDLVLIFPTWPCMSCHKLLQSLPLRHLHYLIGISLVLIWLLYVLYLVVGLSFNPLLILAIHCNRRREIVLNNKLNHYFWNSIGEFNHFLHRWERQGVLTKSWKYLTRDNSTFRECSPLRTQFNSIQFFIHTIQDIYISVHSRKIK